jgi:hypothetical protein
MNSCKTRSEIFFCHIGHSVSTLSLSLRCTYLLKSSPLHSLSGPKTGQWLCTTLESRISHNHQLQKWIDAIASPYWHVWVNNITGIACMRILNIWTWMDLTLLYRNVFSTLILELGIGFVDTWSRLSCICLLAISVWCTHHLMPFALVGGKLLGPTFWNVVACPLLCVTSRCWNAQSHRSYSPHLVYWCRCS